MANEVLFDTSGFYALLDTRDLSHRKAITWGQQKRKPFRPVTTEWIIGETCTLLVARKRPHLVATFLDYVEASTALLVINPDDQLVLSAKLMIRKQADQGYSFVDCISFCLMQQRNITDALTTDDHFTKAGFSRLLD